MSAKWTRSKAWARAHLGGVLTPIRWMLDAMSSIPFGVAMLGVIALWGVLGTIPVGFLFTELSGDALLRQHPALDLTEGDWYRMWPFQLALALFVLSMIVATTRRIEFRWLNVGVLGVHTGIVLIAVGGWCYAAFKREGVMLLPMADGGVYETREVSWFSDMTTPALRVCLRDGTDRVIALDELPRYHAKSGILGVVDMGDGERIVVDAYLPRQRIKSAWQPGDDGTGGHTAAWWEYEVLDNDAQGESFRGWIADIPGYQSSALARDAAIMMSESFSEAQWQRVLGERDESVMRRVFLGSDQAVIFTPDAPLQRIMDIAPGDSFRIADRFTLRLLRRGTHLHLTTQPVPADMTGLVDRHGGYTVSSIHAAYQSRRGTVDQWTGFSTFGDDITFMDEHIGIAFTLMRHELSGAWVRADAFEIEQSPRGVADEIEDFIVGITISDARGESSQTIRLNRPAVLHTLPESGAMFHRLASWLGATRFSLGVSGWDESGQARGHYRYVVLTVGNTPGTGLVAAGGVLFALGTPWAMFVKPRLVRRATRMQGKATHWNISIGVDV